MASNFYALKAFQNKFIFEWDIKDFPMCARSQRGFLESPVFRATVLHESNWTLRLFPRTLGEPLITCVLCRCPDENIPQETLFEAGVEIDTPRFVPDIHQKITQIRLDRMLFYVTFNLSVPDGIDWKTFLWNNTLKLKCTLWDLIDANRFQINEYLPMQPMSFDWEDLFSVSTLNMYARKNEMVRPFHCKTQSEVDVLERTITWSIDNFLGRKIGAKSSLYLKSALGHTCTLVLAVYFSPKDADDDTLMVQFRRINNDREKVHLIKCRVFALGPPDGAEVEIIPELTHLFDDHSSERTIPTSLTSNNLRSDQPLLAGGALKLRFHIAMSLGGCEHTAGAALWTKRPANRVRALQNELLRMYKDRLHCDATLRTSDGRTFGVHRMVLASRSAVFDGWFSRGGISVFDIPDLDAVTLDRLLTFAYSAILEEDLEVGDLLKMYSASVQYDMRSLTHVIKQRILWMVNPRTANAIKQVAERHEASFANLVNNFIRSLH